MAERMFCDCGWEFEKPMPASLEVKRRHDPNHPDDPDAVRVTYRCPNCGRHITVFSRPRRVQGRGWGPGHR